MARVRGRRNFKKWAASNRAGLLAITITLIYTTTLSLEHSPRLTLEILTLWN